MINKRDYFDSVVGYDKRVLNDALLLNFDEFWETSERPYFAESTTILFLTKGTITVSINSTEHEVVAPAMVVYLDGSIVRHVKASEDAMLDAMMLSKPFSDEVLSDANLGSQFRSRLSSTPVFPLDGQENVIAAFNLIPNAVVAQDSPYKIETIKHLVLTILYGFAMDGQQLLDRKKSRAERISDEFFALVKKHYRYSRDVTYYADLLCITPKYLSQSVKDVTGRPALNCIDDFVCAEAKTLLRTTSMSIDQVSDALSFPNQSLFGKYFKRITGMSPRMYRNSTK